MTQDDPKAKTQFLPRQDVPFFIGLLFIFALLILPPFFKTPLPIGGWIGFVVVAAPVAVILLSLFSHRPLSGTASDDPQAKPGYIPRRAMPAIVGLLLCIPLMSIPALFHLSATYWYVFGLGALLAPIVGAILSIIYRRQA